MLIYSSKHHQHPLFPSYFLITVEENTATLDLNSIEKSNLELIKEFKEIVEKYIYNKLPYKI